MAERRPKNIFMHGAIDVSFITDVILQHSSKTNIGANSIFLGQVRADTVDGKTVKAIDYTAYEDMARDRMAAIREAVFAKYPLICLHVYHSLGTVPAGQVCLFVFVSSQHRKAATDACAELVERLKAELPIWGKELLAGNAYQWKVNK